MTREEKAVSFVNRVTGKFARLQMSRCSMGGGRKWLVNRIYTDRGMFINLIYVG